MQIQSLPRTPSSTRAPSEPIMVPVDIAFHILSYIPEELEQSELNKSFYEAHIIKQFSVYKAKNLLSKYIPKGLLSQGFISLEKMGECVKIVTRKIQSVDNNLNRIFPCILQQLSQAIRDEGNAIIEGDLSIKEKASQIRLFLETHQTECSEIRLLIADGIGLTAIPTEVYQLSNLRQLSLRNNHIDNISPEISQLTNLTWFNLASNRISVIPPEIGELTSLEAFHLHYNNISVMPQKISQLTNLEVLSLGENQIAEIDQEIIRRSLPQCEIFGLELQKK